MQQRTACAVLVFSLLGGCASTQRLAPIAEGAAVDIVVARAPQTSPAVDIRNQALGKDTSTGASVGALTGALWGLSCGPLVILCAPLGFALGGLTGTVAGAGVGVTGALSDEKTAQLRDRLARAQASHDMLDELRSNINDRARRHWTLGPDPAASIVTVELQDLMLTSTRDEQIGFIVRVRVKTRPGGAGAASTEKLYEYVGPASSLAVWLQDGSDFVDTTFSSAVQQIATQIVSELSLK